MTTTPDYAGLSRRLGALVYHILQTGTADGQDAQTCFEAAEAIRTLLERNAALERERDKFEAKKISLQDDVIPGLIYRAEAAEAALADRDKEIAALREDAERYRCLSSMATQQADYLGPIFRIDVRRTPQTLFNFDAAVDHARRALTGGKDGE